MSSPLSRSQKQKLRGLCSSCSNPPVDGKRYCKACQDRIITWRHNKEQERRSLGLCPSCGKSPEPGKKRCPSCLTKCNYHSKRQKRELKIETLNAYGGSRCVCCGEDDISFLTLDHINNDGAEHRRLLTGDRKNGGSIFYRKLRRLGYPPGLQVLCFNCNCARAFYGECPHKTQIDKLLHRESSSPFSEN